MNANMEPIVFVVDDDAAARGAIAAWLEREGLRVEQCDAEQFVASCSPTLRGCVILDSSAGVRSGLDVHEHLVARGCELPIIAIAVEGASLALRTARWSLAVDFMEKPLDPQQLLAAIRHALRHAGAVKQANVPLTAPKPPGAR